MILFSGPLPLLAADDAIVQGIAEYKDESFEEAIETLERAREAGSDSPELLYYLGLSYKASLQFDQSRKLLEAARSSDVSFMDIHYHLGEVLYALGRGKEAAAELRQSVASGVEVGRSSYVIGLIQFTDEEYAAAIDSFARAAETQPSVAGKALYSMALAQRRTGDEQAARKSLNEVIALAPDSYEAVKARNALESETAPESQLTATASLAYSVDTNVVLKPSSNSAGVVVSRARDSSVDMTMGLNFARQVDQDWGFSASYGVYQNLHRYLNYFDVQSHHVDITPYMTVGDGNAFLRVSADGLAVDYRRYLLSFGAMAGYIMPFDGHQQGMLQAGYQRKIFFQPPSSAAENQDGHNYHVGYTHTWMSGQGTNVLRQLLSVEDSQLDASYAMDIENTRGSNWSYVGHHFKGIYSTPVRNDWWVSFSADYYRQVYRGIHSAFGKTRKDRLSSFSPSVEWRGGWFGSTFRLQSTMSLQHSNIAVFDYRRLLSTISVEGSW